MEKCRSSTMPSLIFGHGMINQVPWNRGIELVEEEADVGSIGWRGLLAYDREIHLTEDEIHHINRALRTLLANLVDGVGMKHKVDEPTPHAIRVARLGSNVVVEDAEESVVIWK